MQSSYYLSGLLLLCQVMKACACVCPFQLLTLTPTQIQKQYIAYFFLSFLFTPFVSFRNSNPQFPLLFFIILLHHSPILPHITPSFFLSLTYLSLFLVQQSAPLIITLFILSARFPIFPSRENKTQNPKFPIKAYQVEFLLNCVGFDLRVLVWRQMGLQIFEEFRPITPIRTVPLARTFNQCRTEPSDPQVTKELSQLLNVENDQECHTPKSPSHTLSTPVVCPPAPKKPRLARRNVAPPPQGYFQVPHDLASVFLLHKPSKKIRATS